MPKVTLLGRPVRDKILTAHRDDTALDFRRITYQGFDVVRGRVRQGVREEVAEALYRYLTAKQ